MFRLARLILFVGGGFYLGYEYKGIELGNACTSAGGTLAGNICLGAGASQ